MADDLSKNDKLLFWGCFMALITTAFGFISRLFLLGEWGPEFGLDPAQVGELAGIGIWPFAISIIGFSLIIDRIGYKVAMMISFGGYIIWSIMGVAAYFVSDGGKGDPATGYQLLYWGSLILGLSNGTVEAYINPVVATMFRKDKTKWLNILHAGWPGGLVVAGLVTIVLNSDMITGGAGASIPWWIKIAIIAPPALLFFVMLIGVKFPEQERVSSGVTYKEMLSEFGILAALIVGFLITLQLMQFFPGVNTMIWIGVGVGIVAAFGAYTKSLGNPFLFFMALIMMPLATTEIGTDGWIENIMKGVAEGNFDPGLVLVYTSLIMMVLRFYAGPIVHKLSPIGLLIASAAFAIVGLYTLSFTAGVMIFAAATLYALGKTFFWPTMLGVISEQTPKGGALTLNAMGGIGMLAVGVLGFPYIGALQADKQIESLVTSDTSKNVPNLLVDGDLTVLESKKIYEIIVYQAINDTQLTELTTAASLFPQNAAAYAAAEYEKGFDKDEDGSLNDAEKKAMADDQKKQIETQAEKDDTNHDGTVSEDEKKAAVKKAAEADKKTADAWSMRWDADSNWKDSDEKLSDEEEKKKKEDEQKRKETWMTSLDTDKDGTLSAEEYAVARKNGKTLADGRDKSNQGALANMAMFPVIMLLAYIGLFFYFKSKGGYKAIELDEATSETPPSGDEGSSQ
jgi:MFS family permease